MRARTAGAVVLLADLGDRLVGMAAGCLLSVLLVFSGYCLWDSATLAYGAMNTPAVLRAKPTQTETQAPTLAELQAANPDIRAWLTVDDTHIDYPVVQGQDDVEYINKAADGSFALSGSIFLAAGNAADFSDAYSLIYGHHMDSGAMFGDLPHFAEADYFADHTTGTLYLEGCACPLQIFACLQTDAYDPVIYTADPDPAALAEYIQKNAVQYRDTADTGRVVALSTCDESRTNGRVVVFARLQGGN